MIAGLSIKNFKAIRELTDLPLSDFHVLVGPNGVGKSTFLDAVDFVRDCLVDSPRVAVESRGIADFKDLTWMRQGGVIEVALWLDFSKSVAQLSDSLLSYRLAIRQDDKLGICIEEESLNQFSRSSLTSAGGLLASDKVKPKRLLGKTSKGTDFYAREKGSYVDSFNFGLDKLTLGLTPPDESRYPTANAVRQFLTQGVRYIQLDSPAMRYPCPATRGTELDLDGTNLARVLGQLLGANGGVGAKWSKAGTTAGNWAEHLQYALPSLESIGWSRRLADNAEYLLLRYESGLEAPSWVLSDGTLRMLALTILAYLPPRPAIYMIEEPENGVHPKALEIILRSLSSIPGAQMIVATHSPFVVQQCGVKPLLCFSSGNAGAHIVPGPEHPTLRTWDGSPDLGIVFAAGLLE